MFIAPLPRVATRPFRLFCAFLIASACALSSAWAQGASALDGFNPDVNGNVYALATQADGKIIVGGQFTAFTAPTGESISRSNLARLNVDGSLDRSFNPAASGPVRAIVVQPDGRILIGGDFTALQPGGSGATIARGRVARLNPDGSVDAGFNPNVSGSLLPQVYALLLQPNGQVIVGGSFTSAQPNGLAAAVERTHLARFNANGSLDTAFNPRPNGIVLSLASHVEGKLIVGGGFTSIHPASDAAATTRNRIARLNANGTVDANFNPDANNGVTTLAVQRDGKILLGGYFTTLQPVGDTAPAGRQRIARLNVDGTLDSEFIPRADGSVMAITVQPDGGILVGGSFGNVWGRGSDTSSRSFVARFNSDGALDSGFAPSLNGLVDAFAFQSDGKIIIGGYFTSAIPRNGVSGVVRNRLARLNAEGSLDTNFELDAGGRVLASVTQSDGRIVIGGTFTSVGGVTRNYVARVNADGTIDPTYHPNLNSRVLTMAIQADNKVIIGGTFTTVGGETRNYLARLNPNGTIDSEFTTGFDGPTGVIRLQSDGRILVGGTFTTVTPARGSETRRPNLVRLNADGTLDTAFDPAPNSGVNALALQSDGKMLIGGQFNSLAPGSSTNTSAQTFGRGFLARLNADGTLDTAHNASVNARVSAIVIQSDGKAILGGAFTAIQGTGETEPTTRNYIARLNPDGAVDQAYNPNANRAVLALALQSDGRLLAGGPFTTFQPNGASDWTLRKYAARLNTDGTVDATFDLDLNELSGNRVDSLRVLPNGQFFIGGSFASLHPIGAPARITRPTFARLNANGAVDVAFDPAAGGSTGAVVNGFAVQPDNKVIAVGSFSDLGGSRSTNVARFNPEGTPDATFSPSLATDGPVNAVALRLSGAPIASQLAGFAWLNANGTLRSAFAASANRLSGQIQAIAVQANGSVLLGGAFSNLDNTTGGNLVRFNANGTLDPFFNPRPNGSVSSIVIQPDGRVVIAGSFTTINDVARNRIARIDANGALDTTFDPNVNGLIESMVLQSDGKIVIAGAFSTLQPNLATTTTARNFIARINADGTLDAPYYPNPNFTVNAVVLQSDGKIVAGGGFSAVQPNATGDVIARSGIARFNTDGTVDANFSPLANAPVNAIVALPSGQFVIGGNFTTLQPNATGAVITRNYLARINSDGAVDAGFNPSPNAAVDSLGLQSDGSILLGGAFSGLQPGATGAIVTRNRLARVKADGSLDFDFNPNLNGPVAALTALPDGSVLVGGNFNQLQLIGSIVIGGNFGSVGGVSARNLAILNDDGSVSTTFQPRPDGAVNAVLTLADGKIIVGGAFNTIAGVARSGVARFNADGTLDTTFNATVGGAVHSLAMQADGRILVGGALPGASGLIRLNANGSSDASFAATVPAPITALGVQADGRIVYISNRSTVGRLTASGSPDAGSIGVSQAASAFRTLALQANGGIILGGSATIGGSGVTREFLARVLPNGTIDSSFDPMPNAAVTAVALQPDGRLMIGGGFTRVGGVARVGIARLSSAGAGTQMLGVSADRTTVMWSRSGPVGEVSSVLFERSADRATWTSLGEGRRSVSGSDWQLTGLNLPASGVFYLRVRAITPTGGTSSGLYETVREFNFSNPAATPADSVTAPVQAAAPVLGFDPITGIAPRSMLIVVPGEDTVEIIAARAAQVDETGASRLVNLSTRGQVAADTPLILGFAINGTAPRSVLVRAAGPALVQFGVSDALLATRLQIYDSAGTLITTVNPGASSPEASQAAVRTGAFPFAAGSANSAALITLPPGSYTAQVIDAQGGGGVGLAEIYDAGGGNGSRLVNVSSRASTGSGSAALISGFVITGASAERVLLRGVGPSLEQFGASGVADPSIALYDGNGIELGGNDNWVSSVSDVSTAARQAGAFALASGSKDAAVLATLPAGAYTVQVRSAVHGSAMLEIYEVP